MGTINKIRAWTDQIIANFNCGLNGHSEVIILHRYEESRVVKNFKGSSLKNLRLSRPYAERIEKAYCRACGETFLRRVALRSGAP
jgi:hypothetical protein